MTVTRRLFLSSAAALVAAPGLVRAQTPDPSWPKTLTLGTASVGGTYFVYGQAWATLVGEKIGVPINTQQTQGPNQNIILVQGKNIDLGMTTMGIALQAWNGQGDWTKGQKMRDIRALFPMYDTPFHFVVMKRSGINSVAQLAGKRVGVGPRAGTPGTYYPIMFQTLGIQNVTIRNGQGSDMASQLADGLIDCFAFAAGLPIASYSELEATNEVAFFSFTPEQIAKLKQAMPELRRPRSRPAPTRACQRLRQRSGVFNFAIAHKELPDSLAYAIVKAVHARTTTRWCAGTPRRRKRCRRRSRRTAFLSFHPGAARYYKERGQNIPANLVG